MPAQRLNPISLVVLAGAFAAATTISSAQDFRIDTEVFVGAPSEKKENEKKPDAEALTIFTNGMVYDFLLADAREMTLFDPSRGRFMLLDESRRLKTSLTTDDMLDYVFSFETHAAQSKDVLFAFAAKPEFETTTEEVQQNGQSLVRVTLAGDPLSYTALGQRPQHPKAVHDYRQFADWFARLNAARPGNLPPGARLALNQVLAEQGLLPLEVTRTITSTGTFGREKKLEVKTRHLVNWTLSGEDRKRVEHAGECLVTFEPVSFDEYRTAPKPAAAPKQARR